MMPQDAMSDRLKRKFAKYVPRQKLPGEAPPAQYNVMDKRNKYVPPRDTVARAGANDHLKFKSLLAG